jgi:hypothetical protein
MSEGGACARGVGDQELPLAGVKLKGLNAGAERKVPAQRERLEVGDVSAAGEILADEELSGLPVALDGSGGARLDQIEKRVRALGPYPAEELVPVGEEV